MGAAASIMCRQEAEPRPSHPPKAVDLHLNSNSSLRLTPRSGLDLDTNWSPHPRTPKLSVMYRGGAANFGFISITYHQYIFGLCKYILRLEISIFDRENNKNHQELRIIICFRDIQSGTINVGY